MLVELVNIQSIRKGSYDIAEVGVTQIIGENSNGKSVLIKAMSFVANGKIEDQEERDAIINDNCEVGYIQMSRNGMTLLVCVARHRDNCYYKLTRADGTSITRTIRESGLDKIANEFGWVSFSGNICLQIFETFGIMPFVNSTATKDYELIDYVTTDKVANDFVETYEKETYPEFKSIVSSLKVKLETINQQLSSITIYDTEKYELILSRLKSYSRNIGLINTISITRLPITKAVKYIDIEPINVTRLPITKAFKYIDILPIKVNKLPIINIVIECDVLSSLSSYIEDYTKSINGYCPLCNTKFIDMVDGGHLND